MTLLKSYRSLKTEIKESLIDGQGLFAKTSINKGEIVVVRAGHIITEKELHEHSDIIDDSDLQISDNLYLAPLSKEEFKNIMTFVNHSCNPNLGLLGNIIFVAMQNIEAGQELLLDYAMFDNNNDQFICNCKSKNCRKIITGKDWMKKDLQDKYGDYFSSYLLEKIRKTTLK